MELEDLQRALSKIMIEQNTQSVPVFEGYSPHEMHQIIYFTFEPDTPVVLQKLTDPEYQKIPMLNQTRYLLDLIEKAGELKLTQKGFLPTKVVADIYEQKFMQDNLIESGMAKLYKEADSASVHLTRILCELARLTKKRNGKLSLTKLGEKVKTDNFKLLQLILTAFGSKFNWAYFDGYGENDIGQLGYGFSLILMSKYGSEKRLVGFYADKYFMAYPGLLHSTEPPRFGTLERFVSRCYALRTFDRFLNYFGLISIEKTGPEYDSINYVIKTDLFDKLVKINPPQHIA